MFKRVERKRKRREEVDKLGLDEETKEILGMHDTDSDESQSDPDSEPDEDEVQEEDQGFEDTASNTSNEDDENPSIPIHSALLDPLYILSLEPQLTKGCVVCPGKFLKSKEMFETHVKSNAHTRRFKQFSKLVADVDPNEDAWSFSDKLRSSSMQSSPKQVATPTSALSKRAAKKKARSTFLKEKHAKRKAAAKAKKAAGVTQDSVKNDNPNLPTSPKGKPKVADSKKARKDSSVSKNPLRKKQKQGPS
ncbi:hypothetical protein K435DRAFT_833637 [Dendrothele bispora CBS 962.96]|uniref:Uncharacterized protein n=1 Tax=Dendrothele bispora (strain CBS 962.96) TaxID=1314807 RepID=A0A4S8MXS6_DENBC|nr:hypothetical protein K435DRAFT_833637 [Dendrothele bispora CBS 962.96]